MPYCSGWAYLHVVVCLARRNGPKNKSLIPYSHRSFCLGGQFEQILLYTSCRSACGTNGHAYFVRGQHLNFATDGNTTISNGY